MDMWIVMARHGRNLTPGLLSSVIKNCDAKLFSLQPGPGASLTVKHLCTKMYKPKKGGHIYICEMYSNHILAWFKTSRPFIVHQKLNALVCFSIVGLLTVLFDLCLRDVCSVSLVKGFLDFFNKVHTSSYIWCSMGLFFPYYVVCSFLFIQL